MPVGILGRVHGSHRCLLVWDGETRWLLVYKLQTRHTSLVCRMELGQSNNLCQTQRLLRCQCCEQNLSKLWHMKPKLSACQDTTKWSNEEGNVYLFVILVNSPFTQRLYQTLHMDPQQGRTFFFLLWALQYFCPEAASRHSASFWRLSASTAPVEDAVICVQSSGRTSLGPPVLDFVPRCRLPSVPSLSHHFPPLIISTLLRSSAALLLWAVICSAIVQYILPPRSRCRRPPAPLPSSACD